MKTIVFCLTLSVLAGLAPSAPGAPPIEQGWSPAGPEYSRIYLKEKGPCCGFSIQGGWP